MGDLYSPIFGQQSGGLGNGNWYTNQTLHAYSSNGTGTTGQQAYAKQQALLAYYNSANSTSNPIKRAGLKVGEFIGWRMWQIKGDYLQSYSAQHIWPPHSVMKEDNLTDHGSEGIWSFKEKSRALHKMMEYPGTAYGSIKMWGDVIEYTEGYRAQFAKIISIDDVYLTEKKSKKQVLADLRATYFGNTDAPPPST